MNEWMSLKRHWLWAMIVEWKAQVQDISFLIMMWELHIWTESGRVSRSAGRYTGSYQIPEHTEA